MKKNAEQQIVRFSSDNETDSLNPEKSLDELTKLISLLCGVSVILDPNDSETKEALSNFLSQVQSKGGDKVALSYEQFNELMLLLKQDRVERPFFDFFFLKLDIEREAPFGYADKSINWGC